MAKKIQIAVLGGDARQVSAAEWLVEHGCQVSAWGLCDMSTAVEVCESPDAAIREAEVLLLPIPLSRDQLWVNGTSLSVSTLSSILRPGMTVLCPGSCLELQQMLAWAVCKQEGPVAIRYPRGADRHSQCGALCSASLSPSHSVPSCAQVGRSRGIRSLKIIRKLTLLPLFTNAAVA